MVPLARKRLNSCSKVVILLLEFVMQFFCSGKFYSVRISVIEKGYVKTFLPLRHLKRDDGNNIYLIHWSLLCSDSSELTLPVTVAPQASKVGPFFLLTITDIGHKFCYRIYSENHLYYNKTISLSCCLGRVSSEYFVI